MTDEVTITLPSAIAQAVKDALHQAKATPPLTPPHPPSIPRQGRIINIRIFGEGLGWHDLRAPDNLPVCALKMCCVGKWSKDPGTIGLLFNSTTLGVEDGQNHMTPLHKCGIQEGAVVGVFLRDKEDTSESN